MAISNRQPVFLRQRDCHAALAMTLGDNRMTLIWTVRKSRAWALVDSENNTRSHSSVDYREISQRFRSGSTLYPLASIPQSGTFKLAA